MSPQHAPALTRVVALSSGQILVTIVAAHCIDCPSVHGGTVGRPSGRHGLNCSPSIAVCVIAAHVPHDQLPCSVCDHAVLVLTDDFMLTAGTHVSCMLTVLQC